MTIFVLACAAILILALLWLGAPLWRREPPVGDNENTTLKNSNMAALQDQLQEAKDELEAGRLEQSAFVETERELATRMVEENHEDAETQQTAAQPVLFAAIALLIAVVSVGLYMDFGETSLLTNSPESSQMAAEPEAFNPERANARVVELRRSLETDANNPTAWVELARLERRLGDSGSATRSYQHAVMLAQDDRQKTELQLEMVETFAVYAEQNQTAIPPMALVLVNEVLARHEDHPRALWYGSMLAESAGQRDVAIQRIEKLLTLNPPEQIRGALLQQLNAWRAEAEGQPGAGGAEASSVNTPSATSGRNIAVIVDIPNGTDVGNTNAATLFVYARPANGGRMPLAVWRQESPIFPLEAVLNDSLAMMPGTKLAAYEALEIIARISFTGNAISEPGDWFGSQIIGKTQDTLSISIDEMVE